MTPPADAPAAVPDASAPTPSSTPPLTYGEPKVRSSAALNVLATLAVIVALWWGKSFLIPLSAGLMLVMLVMPLNVKLSHWLHNTVLATVITLALVMGTLGAGAAAFGGQLIRVAERVPEMISLAAQRMAQQDPSTSTVFTRVRDALQELDQAADRVMSGKSTRATRRAVAAANAAAASAPAANNNITVGATVALRETAFTGSGLLLEFAGTLSIIFFIAFFVLIGGKAFTERFLCLWANHPDAHDRARKAMLECAHQIRLYAGVLLIANVLIGGGIWLAFMLMNLPDAAGWGVTAAVLHVIPYLGMAVLTGLGSAESFLAHGTLTSAFGMAAFIVALSTVIGTVITAWMQGRAARMNPAAVFIGLVFWGSIWGIWGLFLGPALVVLIKVIAEHTRSGVMLAKLMEADPEARRPGRPPPARSKG